MRRYSVLLVLIVIYVSQHEIKSQQITNSRLVIKSVKNLSGKPGKIDAPVIPKMNIKAGRTLNLKISILFEKNDGAFLPLYLRIISPDGTYSDLKLHDNISSFLTGHSYDFSFMIKKGANDIYEEHILELFTRDNYTLNPDDTIIIFDRDTLNIVQY